MITSHKEWLEEYRKDKYKRWIRTTLSDNSEYYLPNYEDWYKIKNNCYKNNLKVIKVGLQYRSHHIEVDTSDANGVYLVRSVIGSLAEKTRQTITIGKIYGNIIKKQLFVTPELIEEFVTEDKLEDAFEEAIIFNYEKTSPI